MGLIKIAKPSDDKGGQGTTIGHIIRVFLTGTSTLIAEYAPALASPVTDPFQSYDAVLPDGNYDFQYINPNLVDSTVFPRVYKFDSTKGWLLTELNGAAGGTPVVSAGAALTITNVNVGIDTIYLDAANWKNSTTVVAKVVALGTKVFGSPDHTAKTYDGVVIPVGSSYLPSVKFQNATTSADIGTHTINNSNAYTQFNYYVAPAVDATAPTSIYIAVNNATGAYTRLKPTYVPTKGTVVLNPDGKLIFTPTAGATGSEVVQYQIVSSNGTILSEASDTIIITAQGSTSIPVFAERAFGLTDGIKVKAPNGIIGGTCKLYSDTGTLLATLADVTGSGFVIFTGLTLTALQKVKATWTETNKNESAASALITVYPKPTAVAKTVSTAFNTPITINVLDGDSNVGNLSFF